MKKSFNFLSIFPRKLKDYLVVRIKEGNDSLLKKMKLFIIIRPWLGLGEQVCMTAAISAVKQSDISSKIVVITDYPDVFMNNPNIYRVINAKKWFKFCRNIFLNYLNILECKRIKVFDFRHPTKKFEVYMRETKAKEHLIFMLMKHFDLPVRLMYSVRPEIYFSEEENSLFAKKYKLSGKYCVIHSCGVTNYTPNKEWGSKNMQRVIDLTKSKIEWVQLGLSDQPLLDGAIDLRGKTTLREMSYIIKKAMCVVSTEGLYNHIAAAFNTPSVVIFSGFHPVEIAKYGNTFPIVNDSQMNCAPCWLQTPCPIPGKPCTGKISPNMVVEKLKDIVKYA